MQKKGVPATSPRPGEGEEENHSENPSLPPLFLGEEENEYLSLIVFLPHGEEDQKRWGRVVVPLPIAEEVARELNTTLPRVPRALREHPVTGTFPPEEKERLSRILLRVLLTEGMYAVNLLGWEAWEEVAFSSLLPDEEEDYEEDGGEEE